MHCSHRTSAILSQTLSDYKTHEHLTQHQCGTWYAMSLYQQRKLYTSLVTSIKDVRELHKTLRNIDEKVSSRTVFYLPR